MIGMAFGAELYDILRAVWKDDGRGIIIKGFDKIDQARLNLVPTDSANIQLEQGLATDDSFKSTIPIEHAVEKGWRLSGVNTGKVYEVTSCKTYRMYQQVLVREVNDGSEA